MLKTDLNTVEIKGSTSLIAAELEQLLRSAREVFTKTSGKEAANRLMNNIWENAKISEVDRMKNIKKNIFKDPESFRIFVELIGKRGM